MRATRFGPCSILNPNAQIDGSNNRSYSSFTVFPPGCEITETVGITSVTLILKDLIQLPLLSGGTIAPFDQKFASDR